MECIGTLVVIVLVCILLYSKLFHRYTSKRDAMRALQRVLSFSCLEERKYRRILNIEKADSSE